MSKQLTGTHRAAILTALLLLISCAGMGDSVKEVTRDITDLMGTTELPHPVATSLEAMPRDAAIVAEAVERQIAGRGNVKVENIIFMQAARTQLAVVNLPGKDMARTSVHLYEYKAFPENPVIKRSRGRILYEGPGGRSASLLYEAQFRRGLNGIIIDYAEAKPYYNPSPEIDLFVVEASRLPEDIRPYSKSYPAMINFIRPVAMPPKESTSLYDDVEDYQIFVFLKDQLSPGARLEVRKSAKATGLEGISERTQYFNFNGWSAARVSARFQLYSNNVSPPLYIKVILTPGPESGLMRRPKLIGLFHLTGVGLPKE